MTERKARSARIRKDAVASSSGHRLVDRAGADTTDTELPEPLFRLDEYERQERSVISKLLRDLPLAKSPLLALIPQEAVEGALTTRSHLPDGTVVDIPSFAAGATLSLSAPAAIEGDRAAFFAAVNEAADQMTAALVKGVTEQLDKSLEAAGQTVDASGRTLSWDTILETFEKMDWSFDEDGQPEGKSIVAGPDAMARLAALPPPTPEQNERYKAIMTRKKEEFIARRGTRKLPR